MQAAEQAVDTTRVARLILDGPERAPQHLDPARKAGHEIATGTGHPGLLVLRGRRPDHALGRTTRGARGRIFGRSGFSGVRG